jgi:hypothetical protein
MRKVVNATHTDADRVAEHLRRVGADDVPGIAAALGLTEKAIAVVLVPSGVRFGQLPAVGGFRLWRARW